MNKENNFRQGLSFAFRLGTELTVATLLGALMGYALDYFFETEPWFLAIGVLLGGAAGSLNVYRAGMALAEQEDDEHQQASNDINTKQDDS